jgi:signal transduction histidine kinase/ActR/RegA family two-component response regulator
VTLSRRTTIFVLLTLLCLFGGLHAVASRVLVGGFLNVEQTTAVINVERAQQAFDLRVETLSQKLSDWATWDDTYRFVQDANNEYVVSNLNAASIANIGLRFMVFLRSDRTVVYSFAIDSDRQTLVPLPDGLLEALAEPGILVEGTTSDSCASGFLRIPNGILAVASRPILPSSGEGTPRGTLVFGDIIDAADLRAMSERLRFTLELHPLGEEPPEFAALIATAKSSDQPVIAPINDGEVRGVAILDDLLGRPLAAIDVVLPRFVHQQALASSKLLLLTLVIAAVACCAITLLVLRVTVLGRLDALHGDVARVGRAEEPDARVDVRGNDELSELAERVNELLDRVGATQRELADARDAAESANSAKSAFLANMSHEVRTPMTAILGYADILAEQSATPGFKPAECIETIRRNAKHLLAIINDILDLSKIEAGRMQIERLDCATVAVCRDVVELLHEPASRKGIALSLVLATPVPATIHTDPTRLRQILLNLAGNAIKFTTEGSVTLLVGFDRATNRVVVDVVDTGVGIDETAKRRLFAPFSQADASTSRVFGGTGLGLAISRRLAELLGGSLDLHASGSNGSTFRLEIDAGPVAADAPMATSARPIRSSSGHAAQEARVESGGPTELRQQPLAGRRVLVAEDGPDNQRLLSFILGRAGATVVVVADGQAAVDAFRAAESTSPFELVVMDMQMPVLDGYSATRILRSRGVRTPILALTAHAMSSDRAACLDAGCDDYATKPIQRAALIDTCASLIAGGAARRAAA